MKCVIYMKSMKCVIFIMHDSLAKNDVNSTRWTYHITVEYKPIPINNIYTNIVILILLT